MALSLSQEWLLISSKMIIDQEKLFPEQAIALKLHQVILPHSLYGILRGSLGIQHLYWNKDHTPVLGIQVSLLVTFASV
ncbi:hypothetical protein JRO89_XSUnG0019000 [Xanthoceras sorbifolium]|uniref:Uncharacterized protein n=1 Tax=Xanthoceras sorbifolium TaxID=99658 RepID=A0ABQ8H0B4_9ROSI|nr:hypothetical protein JRO89_XSUnG0019000 [Xanthoceras sorbifolium]